MASEISPSRRLTAFSVLPVEPAVDAYVHSPPGGQHRGEPWVGFQFPGLGLGLGASDGLAVVIVDELDGAGAIRWPNSGRGIDLIDINREWPGNENGASAPSRHAGLLFNRLFKPNDDYAIDFHTGATGKSITAFHLARLDLPEDKAMAELFPIDQIFDNPAYPTLLANAFN